MTIDTSAENRTTDASTPAVRPEVIKTLLDRYSGLLVAALLIVIFALWVPDIFLTSQTVKAITGNQAVTGMAALALIIPMAAGAFDLSVAAMLGLSAVLVAWAQSNEHSPLTSVLLALGVGLLVGLVNGFVVVKLNVNSFIATLAMSSLLAGAAFWATGGQPIVSGMSPGFLDLGREQVLGIPLPFIYLCILAGVIWFFLDLTPLGRYLYASGDSPRAARLAGVDVNRTVFLSLVISGVLAALAGAVLAARLGIGSHEVGPSYLLPAFSAAFLGATQIRPGRVNVLGTLVAVFVLAIGVKGFQLAGAPSYVDDLFNGIALIVAVALASRRRA